MTTPLDINIRNVKRFAAFHISVRGPVKYALWNEDDARFDIGHVAERPPMRTVLREMDKLSSMFGIECIVVDTPGPLADHMAESRIESRTMWTAAADLRSVEVVHVASERWRAICGIGGSSTNEDKQDRQRLIYAVAAEYARIEDIDAARSVCVGVSFLLSGKKLPKPSGQSRRRWI